MPKKAGDEVAGELMARGYYRMLGERISEQDMTDLTEMVLEKCKWFPTVSECLDIMGSQSYTNPIYNRRRQARLTQEGYPQIATPQKLIGDG